MTSQLKKFTKDSYTGTWFKYGSALKKWFHPVLNNFVLQCNDDMTFSMEFTVMNSRQRLTGKTEILGKPTNIKMSLNQKVLFITPTKILNVVDMIITRSNRYIIILTDDNILTVLSSSRFVSDDDKNMIFKLITKFGFEEKDFKFSVYDK